MPTTVRARLLLFAVILLLGSLVIAIAGLDGLRRTVSGLHSVYLDRVVPLRDLKTLSDLYAVDVVDASHKARIGTFTSAEAADHIERAHRRARELWQGYLRTQLIPEEKALIAEIEPIMAALGTPLERLTAVLRSGDRAGLERFVAEELYQRIDPLTERIAALIEVQLVESERQYHLGLQTYDRSLYLIAGLLLAMLAGGSWLAWRLSSVLWRQLGSEPAELAQTAQRIAQGQLRPAGGLPAQEGVALSVERMRSSLHHMIGEIGSGNEQLETASLQLATSAEQVLAGATHQSEIASNMAAAMEQLSVSIAHIAESARMAEDTACRAGAASEEGRQVMEEAVREIGNIAELVNHTAEDIDQLARQSENISVIVGVIRGIAEQTNLLALNAAIEAARAGEQGRGFAVVADEVRSLAGRTAQSTAEIVALVEAIQGAVRQARQSMSAGRGRVTHGLELVEEAGTTMRRIGEVTGETREATRAIAQSLDEQRAASDEVAMHVERVAQIVEENTAAQAGISASTHDLQRLGQDLSRLTHRFEL